jgi:hypothetical protein
VSRGGRRASLPEPSWQPPQRGILPEGGGTLVRFLEESGRRSRTYDFSKFKVTPAMQQWLARSFSRRVGTARTSSKRFGTAEGHFYTASSFADVLADCDPQPTSPDGLTGQHIQAYVDFYEGRPVQQHYVKRLRTLLRGTPNCPRMPGRRC